MRRVHGGALLGVRASAMPGLRGRLRQRRLHQVARRQRDQDAPLRVCSLREAQRASVIGRSLAQAIDHLKRALRRRFRASDDGRASAERVASWRTRSAAIKSEAAIGLLIVDAGRRIARGARTPVLQAEKAAVRVAREAARAAGGDSARCADHSTSASASRSHASSASASSSAASATSCRRPSC